MCFITLVQCFKLQGRCFTNFHYYYYNPFPAKGFEHLVQSPCKTKCSPAQANPEKNTTFQQVLIKSQNLTKASQFVQNGDALPWMSDAVSRAGNGKRCTAAGLASLLQHPHMQSSSCLRRQSLHCCCLLYTSPSPRDRLVSRMPSSA